MNSAYICNTLQYIKVKQTFYLSGVLQQFVTETSVTSGCKCVKEPVKHGAFVQDGRCPRRHLSGRGWVELSGHLQLCGKNVFRLTDIDMSEGRFLTVP